MKPSWIEIQKAPALLLGMITACVMITEPGLAAGQAPEPLQFPVAPGPFKPSWESLTNYTCPEWFRDAKFGIWAHWGPQCQPERGDWYARNMYIEGHTHYKHHVATYGHPSKFGFKDIINLWKAEKFDPDKLLAFYKRCGAKYFMALANHHDNFDLWNSKYQPWNAVAIGPKKDLIAAWAKAARKHGLRFAVSVHASHAWSWYEPAQGADKQGEYAGVPYDGKLTKADGVGKWWEGLDPQDLYAQNHPPGKALVWDWNPAKGSSVPDEAYMRKFYLRTQQLWDDYKPDMIYFDDTVLPFHGVTDAVGLHLVAHFYNTSIKWHGKNEAVVTGKHLNEMQRRAMVYDIERGRALDILPQPWQTDTCIGHWHYDRDLFINRKYKTAAQIIPMLADIVSKNGNLMLSVPVRGDGSIDDEAAKIVSDIGAWLRVNGEAIYKTRPWKIYGEGPSTKVVERGQFDGLRDVYSKPFTSEDIRFTQSKDGKVLYAIVLGWPEAGQVTIKALAQGSPYWPGPIKRVRMLGARGKLQFFRDASGLTVSFPATRPCEFAYALRIE
ncbi:MAG: alpha-L-fucosidase [Verrucomicrobiales bacterium]|nr:alpha-L-fucosidase [Verrucomicrobiales bacterium]